MQRACVVALLCCAACGGGDARDAGADASRDSGALDAGGDAGDDGGVAARDAGRFDLGAPIDAGAMRPGLDGQRDRLLATYLHFLQAMPTATQTNGLRGADLAGVCDLWRRLDPSSQAVFLTITARMDGSRLADGSSMLSHVTVLYRCVGGDGATATDPGTCGGGENNRMMMSMDTTLHDALVAANDHAGAATGGVRDISDIPSGGYWRNSHDLAGPHSPFDLSDETNDDGPRGQTQYFRDPASSLASMRLGRTDIASLIDPLGLEMDQDYDCTHNSNPLCSYTFWPSCFPNATTSGIDIYGGNYGAVDAGWLPDGC